MYILKAMSSRTKLIALAVVAVMLPTMILLAGRAEEELTWIAEQALGTLDTESLSRENILELERHFEAVRTANPAIDRLFLSFVCGCESFGVVTSANGSRRFVHRVGYKFVE